MFEVKRSKVKITGSLIVLNRLIGYIPKLMYKFGGTYKNDCDVSIDKHISACNYTSHKEAYLRHMVKIAPKQQVLNHDPLVRDHLNTYRDTHPLPPILAGK